MCTPNLEGHTHKYLDILQMNIQRMSQLSNTCKSWCLTLTSALLLFILKEKQWDLLNVLLLPIGLFYVLDAYYLSVEREFVFLSKAISKKIQNGNVEISDLFVIRMSKGLKRLCLILKAGFWSWSTLPFYGTIFGVLIYIMKWKVRT